MMVTRQLAVVLDDHPDEQQPSSLSGGWVDPEEVVVRRQSRRFC